MFKFKRDNRDYYPPKSSNSKNPFQWGSKNDYRFRLDKTGMMVNSVTKKNTKFVLLNKDKETNYNKKTNTIYVNPRDTTRYNLLKGEISK